MFLQLLHHLRFQHFDNISVVNESIQCANRSVRLLDFSCIVFPYWEFTGNLQYLRTRVYLQEALYVTKFT